MLWKIILGIALVGIAMVSCISVSGKASSGDNWDSVSSLHETYKNEFLIGNIIRSSNAADLGGVRFNLLKYHFNTATAENDMKPDYIAPISSGGEYRFTNADKIVDTAIAAGLKMHGHTLIWHSQTPEWMTSSSDKTILLNNLETYVTDVVTHFKGKVISWDVVNEAMDESDNISEAKAEDWTKCLRNSPWNKAGTEYIEKAFLAARAADPDAKLYYNDYNLNHAYKSQAVYNMVKDINERYPDIGGRPLIDGIGMQTHHHLNTNPATVKAATELLASLGVEIAVSEMDIVANNGGGINDSRLGLWNEAAAQKQAEVYATFFKIYLDNAQHISRVTFWGLDDGTSWRSANHPTLLDKDYGLKPAFYAVMDPDSYTN